MIVVEADAIRAAVGEGEALDAVERGFRALARGEARQPAPLGLEIPESEGEVHVKGAHLRGAPVFALKVATGFYRNPRRGLPTGSGLFLVFDAETGFPLALLRDGGYLTELRTGAAGALAVRLLARAEVGRAGFVGAGVQARYQARAIHRVRPFASARAWSPSPEGREAYCREMSEELGVPFEGAASVEEAVADAAVVVTVTPSREPLVKPGWIAPGTTVVAVGSDGPEKVELAPELLARAHRIVADSVEQCLRLGEIHHAVEAGALSPDEIGGELGEVLEGSRPGRDDDDEIVVCDLTGVGAQDAAVAEAAWTAVDAG